MPDDSFGHWLSGLTDGEGCFSLRWAGDITDGPCAEFAINLRADDVDILYIIQSYLGCGNIGNLKQTRGSNPCVSYRVRKAGDLAEIIVPHFEKFPLRAKKRHDFEIWKEGVNLIWSVVKLPKYIGALRWTLENRGEFGCIVQLLSNGRKYKCDNLNVV